MSSGRKLLDPEVRSFMDRVMREVGVASAGQLAALLVEERRMTYGESRKIAKWARGEHAPGWRSTLVLLDRAGALGKGFTVPPAARRPSLGSGEAEELAVLQEFDRTSRRAIDLEQQVRALNEGTSRPERGKR